VARGGRRGDGDLVVAGQHSEDRADGSSEASAWGPAVSGVGRAHFRPDIEGLRAVAIVAVLLYHVHVPGLAGGFIGVDVFYVISGFLITGLLRREIVATGRIDFVSFYARRARRLLPAALLVILVTLVASGLLLSRLRLPDIAGDAAAAALYTANYRFALSATDYLASTAAPSPLLHYWSLGVEEQFYLAWPLLIALGFRLLSVQRVAWLVLPVAICSLALSIVWTDTAAPWAFFSLPTRAWELAVGALIALDVLRLPRRAPGWLASASGCLGLALIVAGVLLVDASTPYPGIMALLPVGGAALLIVSGEQSRAVPARWLATAAPRWFGRISYSLYLWHWPLLVLIPAVLHRDDLALRVAIGLLAIGLAAASTRWVEAPFREGQLRRITPARGVALAGVASLIVALGSLGLGGFFPGLPTSPPLAAAVAPLPTTPPESESAALSTPTSTGSSPSGTGAQAGTPLAPGSVPPGATPAPTAPAAPSFPSLPVPVVSGVLPANLRPPLQDAAKDLPASYSDGCHLDIASTDPPPCVYGNPSSQTTVVLIGDSHAAQWLPAMQILAQRHDWRLLSLTKSACPTATAPIWIAILKREYRECDVWRERVLSRLAKEHPALAVVASASGYQLVDGSGRTPVAQALDAWHAAIVDFLNKVGQRAGRTVYVAETPHLAFDPLECLASHSSIDACPSRRAGEVDAAHAAFEDALSKDLGIDLVSPTDWLCPGDTCPLVRGRYLVFRDDQHLTATWIAALAPVLDLALGQLP
jgi:peptidoglycan/LPS O-acetylase OafA/YrhL